VLAEDQKNCHGTDAIQSRIVTLIAHKPTLPRQRAIARHSLLVAMANSLVARTAIYGSWPPPGARFLQGRERQTYAPAPPGR